MSWADDLFLFTRPYISFIHLYIWLNPILCSSFCLFVLHKSKYFVTVSEKYTCGFFYGDHYSSRIFVNCLAHSTFVGFHQNLKTEKCLLMRSLPLVKTPTNHLSVLITLKRWFLIDITPDGFRASGETPFPPPSLKQYKPSSGLEQGMCLTHVQNCCGS